MGNARQNGPQLDDSALMEVTGRGSLDENAVKVLQTSGKLSELASSPEPASEQPDIRHA